MNRSGVQAAGERPEAFSPNALLRPLLLLITCPFNLITLGLFTFVVNAVVFWVAANLVPGIAVNGFVGAFVGSLTVTICTAIADALLESDRDKNR